MPNYSEILKQSLVIQEIEGVQHQVIDFNVLESKKKYYLDKIHNHNKRNVISYYSGWLKGLNSPEYSINDTDKNALMNAIYGMNRDLGLDLILHSPGGDIAATESIIDYLHSVFNEDIRVIVPQLAMSCGTMIALASKEIVMGKQSNLGPIDPQFGGLPCSSIIDEFNNAVLDATKNPNTIPLWQSIIGKYHPTLLTECHHAVKWSEELIVRWLGNHEKIDLIKDTFCNHSSSRTHNRHISISKCKEVGLNIRDLEDDAELQDAVLSLHHIYTILFEQCNVAKFIDNHLGVTLIRHYNMNN